jgi:quinol-cytochrome oxidoreductase complex cytochrome b subunit
MGPHKSFIFAAGLFFQFIFLTGFWVRSNGKPYSTTILTIHKLISLAAAVVLGIVITQLNQAVELSSADLKVVVVTGVLFVVSVLSGGIWSIEKEIPTVVLRLHQVTPFLTVLSTAVSLYFLVILEQ